MHKQLGPESVGPSNQLLVTVTTDIETSQLSYGEALDTGRPMRAAVSDGRRTWYLGGNESELDSALMEWWFWEQIFLVHVGDLLLDSQHR